MLLWKANLHIGPWTLCWDPCFAKLILLILNSKLIYAGKKSEAIAIHMLDLLLEELHIMLNDTDFMSASSGI